MKYDKKIGNTWRNLGVKHVVIPVLSRISEVEFGTKYSAL